MTSREVRIASGAVLLGGTLDAAGAGAPWCSSRTAAAAAATARATEPSPASCGRPAWAPCFSTC